MYLRDRLPHMGCPRNAWTCPECGENYTRESLDCHICGYKRPDPNKVIACRIYWEQEEIVNNLEGLGDDVIDHRERLAKFAKKMEIEDYVE